MCGNIANGSPIGDLPPMLIALAADVELAGVSSNRRMPLEDFFIDYGVQDREAGEFVSALLVPVAASPHFRAYKISKRFDHGRTVWKSCRRGNAAMPPPAPAAQRRIHRPRGPAHHSR